MSLKQIAALIIIAFSLVIIGCTPDNPKTRNELLRNKSIGWADTEAQAYGLLANGQLVGMGGAYPREGCVIGLWESVDDNGSFRMITSPDEPETYTIAKFSEPMANGVKFSLQPVTGGKEQSQQETIHTLSQHEDIQKSQVKAVLAMTATAHVTRYANDVYVLDLKVLDENGKIKKVLTEGDVITNEVMVTNAKQWVNNPPILLPKGWDPKREINTTMTIRFHEGKDKIITFKTTGYRDKTSVEFDDAWF